MLSKSLSCFLSAFRVLYLHHLPTSDEETSAFVIFIMAKVEKTLGTTKRFLIKYQKKFDFGELNRNFVAGR